MGSHWYSPVKGQRGWLVKCLPCGDIFGVVPSEIEATSLASKVNKEIEESFRPEGRRVNPASLGLARRMRKAKRRQ